MTGQGVLYVVSIGTVGIEDPPHSGRFVQKIIRSHRAGVVVGEGEAGKGRPDVFLYPTASEPGAVVRGVRLCHEHADCEGGEPAVTAPQTGSADQAARDAVVELAGRVARLESRPSDSPA